MLILAPRGRDAEVTAQVLQRSGIACEPCADLAALKHELDRDVGGVLVTEEAMVGPGLEPVLAWCEAQPPWSDLPIIVLATRQVGRRSDRATTLLGRLGNVMLLERPINAETLTHAVRSALRARRRQYQARALLLEREASERTLRELNETLEQRVEARTAERDQVWRKSRDLLLVLSHDGELRRVNPAWTEILGHEPAEVVGRNLLEFLWPEDAADHSGGFELVRPRDSSSGFDNRFIHKDGTPRWISWHISVEGDFISAYGRHITTEKAQAEALSRTEAALRQSQKMEAVGQLTGGLAHDFNNLLTGISGSLELLQSRLSQGRFENLERYINGAQGGARRAAALTHRLLAFSRRQTLDPCATDANRLIADMEELIRRTAGPSVTVEVLASGGLWTIFVDRNQLENTLLNLAINARDAMPDGGCLTIETCNIQLDGAAAAERELPPGHYVSLCVADSGIGMTREVVARAFDPFFTTKPIGMGTGLGLSMIYGFARQSGGQVRIWSQPGEGTRVSLFLPRHAGAVDDADAALPSLALPRAEAGEQVLLVDDEPIVRMLVSEVLEDLGYAAIEASDGAAGLDVLRSDRRIDLLVTDVGLPGGMNGRQVADAGRVLRPGLKVLFITGYAESAVIGIDHMDAGMHVLTKPFAVETLASRIKTLLNG